MKIDRNINSLIDINKVLNRIKNRDNKSSNVLEGFYDNDFWKLFMINIFSREDKEKKKKKSNRKILHREASNAPHYFLQQKKRRG